MLGELPGGRIGPSVDKALCAVVLGNCRNREIGGQGKFGPVRPKYNERRFGPMISAPLRTGD